MSWRNKKPERGYGRYRGRGPRRGGGEGDTTGDVSENDYKNNDHKQHSGHRGSRGGAHRGNTYKRPAHSGQLSYDSKRTKYKVGERLKEKDIGVTEFVGSHKRLAGILKERFSDFHVHEISHDDKICKLTNQDIPPEPEDLRGQSELMESLPVDTREKLEAFARAESDATPTEIDVTEMEKETRKKIHTVAKRIPLVISETKDRDGRKIIVLSRRKERKDRNFREDRREDWSSREGNYCQFLLHKVNMDTMDALNQLAAKLRIRPNLFHYAGTKDRRAHTTQWVSLRKVSPSNIHAAARQVRGAFVGNFHFSKEPLRLGMLKGNRFKIALRSVTGTDEEIERAMTSLRDHGFINYYGLQRFGSIASIPTHEIGKALLQGKWREAIDLILKPRPGEQQRDMMKAREIYQETKNASSALRPIARSGKIEAALLQGLVQAGENNPQGALDHIPRNARLMYIHAYQSFVWNHIVSRRIKEFGSKPIVGDLIYEKSDTKSSTEGETIDYGLQNDELSEGKDLNSEVVESNTEETAGEQESMKNDDNREINGKSVSPSVETTTGGESKVEAENEILDDLKGEFNLPTVKALTEENLSRYTLADVVMPKPGWKVTYPAYAKPWYDEILAKDELSTDLRQKNKKYSLGGGYRKILETPDALSWKVVHYSGYHDDLIISDIDEMRGSEPPKIETEGKHKALILEFSLTSSTYATMALREILEIDTSAHAQASRSAANQAQEKAEKMKTEEVDAVVKDGEEALKIVDGETVTRAEAENTDKMIVNDTDGPKDKFEIVGATDDSRLAEEEVTKANESVDDVSDDKGKIPMTDEENKMETDASVLVKAKNNEGTNE